jgi:hypothetical protein
MNDTANLEQVFDYTNIFSNIMAKDISYAFNPNAFLASKAVLRY